MIFHEAWEPCQWVMDQMGHHFWMGDPFPSLVTFELLCIQTKAAAATAPGVTVSTPELMFIDNLP